MEIERIKLLVKPGASRNSYDGIYNGRIKIRIKSIPEGGKANKELIRFISKKLGIPKSSITIVSGENSNLKEVAVKKPGHENITSILLND
ncbi:MAG: DUF167 domain-containing protein [Actinobacteria bacterium]|nr:DUF167 domain-containing protein [Actinomycetota bacterium]MBM3712298.1 DUF167 domain-containing protein [Actinomycetota bacterium]